MVNRPQAIFHQSARAWLGCFFLLPILTLGPEIVQAQDDEFSTTLDAAESARTQQDQEIPRELLTDADVALKSGMTPEDIQHMFGEPDKREPSAAQNGIETWHFGDSLVLFSGGKVTAWVDRGDFVDREEQQQFQKSAIVPDISFEDKGWKNAWTPEKKLGDSEVIETILTEPKREDAIPKPEEADSQKQAPSGESADVLQFE